MESWNRDFPMRESYQDCAGEDHLFEISVILVPTGYCVEAVEIKNNEDEPGYYFSKLAENNPYIGLGQLRRTIRKELSTRYLQEKEGMIHLRHDVLKGRIDCDSDIGGVQLIVDGKPLSIKQLVETLATYDGWGLKLQIFDPSDDIS